MIYIKCFYKIAHTLELAGIACTLITWLPVPWLLALVSCTLVSGYTASDHVTLSRCFRNASGYVTASRRGWHTSSVASDNGSDSRCGLKAGHVASGHVIVGS